MKSTDVLFLIGDFNAKLGSAVSDEDVTGRFGLGELNDHGECWKDFCQLHTVVIITHISNTTVCHTHKYGALSIALQKYTKSQNITTY